MKIVFISYFSGRVHRGAETYVHELANRLAKDNSVNVFQSGSAIPDANYLTRQLNLPQDKFNLEVFKNISLDTDILIPTNGRFQSVFARLWCLKHPNTKLLISGQSGPGIDDRINLACFPNRFIALTKFQSDWAHRANPLVVTSVIPNGVDLTHFYPQVKPLIIDLPHPIILYVAALEPIKRHHLLIPALAHTPASLLLVGQGSLFNEIKNQAKALLNDRFKIMSFTHDHMPAVYPACDLFVYPTSPYESFGIAILEALASGLSVVATDDPIRKEIIGESGWFCDAEDSKSLSEKLNIGLSSSPKVNPRVQAAKFSWDKIANDYSKLCASLIL